MASACMLGPSCFNTSNDNDMTASSLSLSLQTQLYLGQTCLNQHRYREAFHYFETAARSGHPSALNMLGRAYERGWGVMRNPARAALYFTEAHRGGDGWAAFNLGDLYLLGSGVCQNRSKAYSLYVTAAEKGVLKALNMLGLLHEEGITGAPDPEGARSFYRAAFERGDGWAALNLARLTLDEGDIAHARCYIEWVIAHGVSDMIEAARCFVKNYPLPQLHALFYP